MYLSSSAPWVTAAREPHCHLFGYYGLVYGEVDGGASMVQGGHSVSLLPSCSAPECRLIVPGSTEPRRAPPASGHVWQQEEKLIEVSLICIHFLCLPSPASFPGKSRRKDPRGLQYLQVQPPCSKVSWSGVGGVWGDTASWGSLSSFRLQLIYPRGCVCCETCSLTLRPLAFAYHPNSSMGSWLFSSIEPVLAIPSLLSLGQRVS